MIRDHRIWRFRLRYTATEYHHDVYGDRVEPGNRVPQDKQWHIIAKGEGVATAKMLEMVAGWGDARVDLLESWPIEALVFEPTW